MSQYTIRNVPGSIDQEPGIAGDVVVYDDLDDLAGTWKQDEVFDQAIADQDTVDPDLLRRYSLPAAAG